MSWILSLDNAILDGIQRLRCPPLDWFMPLYSRLGDHGMICIALAVLLLLFPKTRRAGEAMALALVLCLFSGNLLLKPMVARVRPYDANQFAGLLVPPLSDFSFPSGHTFSCAAAAFVLFHYHKKAGIAAWFAAALMAFSRLYLYVHYPTDILGGLLLGVAAGFLACRLAESARRSRRLNSLSARRLLIPNRPNTAPKRRRRHAPTGKQRGRHAPAGKQRGWMRNQP